VSIVIAIVVYVGEWQWQRKVWYKYVCITAKQPDTKSNPNLNSDPATKQHTIVSIQLNMITCPTYRERNSHETMLLDRVYRCLVVHSYSDGVRIVNRCDCTLAQGSATWRGTYHSERNWEQSWAAMSVWRVLPAMWTFHAETRCGRLMSCVSRVPTRLHRPLSNVCCSHCLIVSRRSRSVTTQTSA